MLEGLASKKEARAMRASHELWVALCQDGIQSAAEPCLPFLIEIIGISKPHVQGEILDLITQFARVPDHEPASDLQTRLLTSIREQQACFQKLRNSHDDIIAAKASQLVSLL